MIRLKTLLEARYQDVEVVPTTGTQRGTSESTAKSFAIIIGNPSVYRKMQQTPMGEPGKMTSFKYDGPEGDQDVEYKWDANTTQWEVWQHMNYLILTSDHHTHWYHGKMPGGAYTNFPGATGKALPDLKIENFGFKVYKALLLEPSVGFIHSDSTSTPQVRNGVYKKLMLDPDFVWITSKGDTIDTYDQIIVINPKHANVKELQQQFEEANKGVKLYYSNNFPKQ